MVEWILLVLFGAWIGFWLGIKYEINYTKLMIESYQREIDELKVVIAMYGDLSK